eukprot:g1754.t1
MTDAEIRQFELAAEIHQVVRALKDQIDRSSRNSCGGGQVEAAGAGARHAAAITDESSPYRLLEKTKSRLALITTARFEQILLRAEIREKQSRVIEKTKLQRSVHLAEARLRRERTDAKVQHEAWDSVMMRDLRPLLQTTAEYRAEFQGRWLAIAAAARFSSMLWTNLQVERQRRAAARTVQRAYKEHLSRQMVYRMTTVARLLRRKMWIARLNVRARQRTESSKILRNFCRAYCSNEAMHLRYTIRRFQQKIADGQRMISGWLRCAEARVLLLTKYFEKVEKLHLKRVVTELMREDRLQAVRKKRLQKEAMELEQRRMQRERQKMRMQGPSAELKGRDIVGRLKVQSKKIADKLEFRSRMTGNNQLKVRATFLAAAHPGVVSTTYEPEADDNDGDEGRHDRHNQDQVEGDEAQPSGDGSNPGGGDDDDQEDEPDDDGPSVGLSPVYDYKSAEQRPQNSKQAKILFAAWRTNHAKQAKQALLAGEGTPGDRAADQTAGGKEMQEDNDTDGDGTEKDDKQKVQQRKGPIDLWAPVRDDIKHRLLKELWQAKRAAWTRHTFEWATDASQRQLRIHEMREVLTGKTDFAEYQAKLSPNYKVEWPKFLLLRHIPSSEMLRVVEQAIHEQWRENKEMMRNKGRKKQRGQKKN